jgi:hypothetical protein
VTAKFCSKDDLGKFILDLPPKVSANDTSFWSARVKLPSTPAGSRAESDSGNASTSGFWNNPEGNPTPPPSPYSSPWRRRSVADSFPLEYRDHLNPSPSGVYTYTQPIQYIVRKTGYYCVGKLLFIDSIPFPHICITAIVPVTVQPKRASTDVPFHPSYSGVVLFKNTFNGQLPATDYPKVTVSPSVHPVDHALSLIHIIVLLLHVPCVLTVRRCMGMAVLQTLHRTVTNTGMVRFIRFRCALTPS